MLEEKMKIGELNIILIGINFQVEYAILPNLKLSHIVLLNLIDQRICTFTIFTDIVKIAAPKSCTDLLPMWGL